MMVISLLKYKTEVLYRITGGNVKALDDFTQLLAKIVAPVPKYPSLAVVFTKKNVKAVRRFFLQLFRQKCKEAGSAIRILQQGREAEILAHQVRGGMLVLLNDQLPSDSARTHLASTKFDSARYSAAISFDPFEALKSKE